MKLHLCDINISFYAHYLLQMHTAMIMGVPTTITAVATRVTQLQVVQ
jgi:hypothetical protein